MFFKISCKIILFSVCIIVLLSGRLFSQDEKYNNVEIARSQYVLARHMTDNLAEKLKLNDSQKKVLVSILLDYQDNLINTNGDSRENSEMVGGVSKPKSRYLDSLVKETNQQIIDILNPGQQGIFYRIKTSWWRDFNKITNTAKKKF